MYTPYVIEGIMGAAVLSVFPFSVFVMWNVFVGLARKGAETEIHDD